MNQISVDRRTLLRAGALGTFGLGLPGLFPAWAESGTPGLAPTLPTLSGENIALEIGMKPFTVGGRTGQAVMINGTIPGPLVRLKEFRTSESRRQPADEDTSIHWHGFILPFQMAACRG